MDSMKKLIPLLVSVWLVFLSSIGHAASITVSNYNFETGGFVSDGNSSPGVIPTGWSAVNGSIDGGFFGYWNPSNSAYPGTTGNGVIGTMDGPNMFYFGSATNGQGIFQVLSTTFSTNTNYALTVASGARIGGFMASLEMQLYAGSTLLGDQIVKNTNLGTVQDFTLNYTANSANNYLAGQSLKIQFLERDFGPNDFEVDIDNIRMTSAVSVVPEPSTYALFGLGAIGMLLVMRRKKTS
jgi:PEP-CTERM motif